MPYGVDTIQLRITFPAAPVSQGYNGRAWRMRPLRGWTGGARWDEEAAAAAQASAGSSLRATLDRVIATTSAGSPAVEAQGSVQLSQAEPLPENEAARRVEPDESPLSDAEVFRLDVHGRLRTQLKKSDPENAALRKPYLTGRGGFVPAEADLEALGQALNDAHSRRSPPQEPVNTPADPGGPEMDETGPQKRQHASEISDHQVPVTLYSLTLAGAARNGDPYVGTVAVRDGTRALFSLQAVANQFGANVQPAAVIFGHGVRHIDPLVAPDLQDAIIGALPGTLPFGVQGQGRIIFGGTSYLFRYYDLSNGDVHVGTHFPE